MPYRRSILVAVIGGAVSLSAHACGGGSGAGSGSGVTGTYTSVADGAIKLEFKSGGTVAVTMEGAGSSGGTFTVDGEKIVVATGGLNYMFIRDGDCIRDQNDLFGKMCKGGKAGEATNVSTRNVPATPAGTYLASSADGEFRLEFKPGDRLTLTATPPDGKVETHDGSFIIEGDVIHATLPQGVPLVLKFVNDGYESTSFGFPMRFVKQ
jgi:hypothetical protein